MGKKDYLVKETLGKEAWDELIARAEDGSISSQHMKDFSFALHRGIGGNHSRRVSELHAKCDASELREILSEWWDQELPHVLPAFFNKIGFFVG